MFKHFLFTLVATVSFAPSLMAQVVFTEDVVINGTAADDQLCVGDNCSNTEAYSDNAVKIRIRDEETALEFVDVTTGDPNWILEANDGSFPGFHIGRSSDGSKPFVIKGGAPSNSLVIADNGRVGVGTELPIVGVHIVDGIDAGIRLENTLDTPYKWDLRGNSAGFYIFDSVVGSVPVNVRPGAPTGSLEIASNGNVGIGTQLPGAPLDVSSLGNFNFFRISAKGAPINESVDIVFTKGPLNTGQLRYNIVENGDNPQVPEMTLDANGNMVLTGTLTTSGPTCTGGCDRVFDADYDLPSIADHATAMFASGHLPAVGPTRPGAPVNLTENMANMLNALEHAHIYINQLHERDIAKDQIIAKYEARLNDLTARLEAVEAE